ncbi:MAG: hypothetical protein ACREJ0_28660 [Geminicoccaceae bacterium]
MTAGKVLATGVIAFADGAFARRLVAHNAPVRVLVRDATRGRAA